MTKKLNLLVTGLNGVVGQALMPALQKRYTVSALSRSGVEGLPAERVFKADIADLGSLSPAFEGVDVVLNLAADGGVGSADGMNGGWEQMLRNNIVGAYNVLETARQAGVSRVVLASSGATVNGYERDEPYSRLVATEPVEIPTAWKMIDEFAEPRPVSIYGVTKLFGEDLGRYFALTSPLSVINIRISSCGREDVAGPGRAQANWVSYRDLQQLTVKCIEAPAEIKFDIFWATSNNRLGYRDLTHPRKVLGYVPRDGVR